jgi:hypothetical protein
MAILSGIFTSTGTDVLTIDLFLWGGKTRCALIATPNVDDANRRQKKGKS